MRELSPYFIHRTGIPAGPPILVSEPARENRPEPGFWDFWRVIRTRRKIIVLFFLALTLAVTIGTLLMTPIYTSEATLLIQEKTPQVVDIRQALSETIGTEKHDYYATQVEILKSPSLAAQVIQEQRLETNENFTSKSLARAILSGVKKTFYSGKSEVSDATATLRKLTATYVEDHLEIKPVANTHLVKILFRTPDPHLSAEVANAHARAYISQGLKFRSRANADAEHFLDENLVHLKQRLEKAEAALNNYRRERGIISLNDKENVVVERLADLNKRLTEAEAERISLQAQVQLIRQRAFESLPEVINNQLIRALKEQLSRAEGEYANLSAEYNIGYPRMAQLKAQIDETRRRLNEEIRSVVAGIDSAFLAAGAKEKQLRAKFGEQRNAALQLKDASVEYAILAREVDTNRKLYENLFQRRQEIDLAEEVRTSNTSIVDEAKPPLEPSHPKKTLNLLLGILVGAMGGVGLAFLVEYLDKTVSRPEDVERYVHLPTVGIVPDFSTPGQEGEPSLLDNPNGNGSSNENGSPKGTTSHIKTLNSSLSPRLSLVAESYRNLQTSILFSQTEEPPKTVLFASGCPGEGKTTTTINIAVVFAQMEAKVLVIDADLRKPSCHKRLMLKSGPGLTEFLTGQRALQEVIKVTLTDNLFVITGGGIPPNPAKLVGSRKMYDMLSRLREQFDYIFIDSPPLVALSDAVRLSTMVDGVVLVVKGHQTTRDGLVEACSRLHYAHAKIVGVVLNGVNLTNGDYSYYNPYYSAYASPAGA
jgi:polysaccharide biosynthesis transport protein